MYTNYYKGPLFGFLLNNLGKQYYSKQNNAIAPDQKTIHTENKSIIPNDLAAVHNNFSSNVAFNVCKIKVKIE